MQGVPTAQQILRLKAPDMPQKSFSVMWKQPSPELNRAPASSRAKAASQVEEGDGYAAALVNFRFIANDTITTKEAVASMSAAR